MQFLGLFLVATALATVGSLVFLGHPYTSDDHWLIATLHDRSLREIVGICLMGQEEAPPGLFYRPLWRVSFWLDANLWPNRPVVSHAVGVLWHALAVFTTSLLALRLSGSKVLALGVALFASVQPAGLEAVSWVASRGDPMAVVFGCLGLVWLLTGTGRARLLLGSAALLACFASKEAGFVFAPALVAAVLVHPEPGTPLRRGLIRRACWVCGLLGAWILLRGAVLGSVIGSYPGARRQALFEPDGWIDRLDMLGELLFFGALDGSGFEAAAVIAFALLLAAGLLGSARGGRDARLAWVGGALLFGSAMLWHGVPVAEIGRADDRYYYVPALGYVLLFAGFARALPRPRPVVHRALVASAVLVFLALLSLRLSLHSEHRRAGAAIRQYYAAVRAEAANGAGPLLLVDSPGSFGPLLCGQYSLPHACLPPFGELSRERLTGVTQASFHDQQALPISSAFIAMQPGGRIRTWDEERSAFRDGDLCAWPTRSRIRVGRVATDGGEILVFPGNPAAPPVRLPAGCREPRPGDVLELRGIEDPCCEPWTAWPARRVSESLTLEGNTLIVAEPSGIPPCSWVLVYASKRPSWVPLGPNGVLSLAASSPVARLSQPGFPCRIDLDPILSTAAADLDEMWVQVAFLWEPTVQNTEVPILLSELLRLQLGQL